MVNVILKSTCDSIFINCFCLHNLVSTISDLPNTLYRSSVPVNLEPGFHPSDLPNTLYRSSVSVNLEPGFHPF